MATLTDDTEIIQPIFVHAVPCCGMVVRDIGNPRCPLHGKVPPQECRIANWNGGSSWLER